jgi:glycerophosphoryl diester phosphodiesterase
MTTTAEDFTRKLVAAIRAGGMEKRAAIQSFDWRTLQVVQKEAPGIPAVYLTVEKGFMDSIERDKTSSPWTAAFHVSRYGDSIPRTVTAAGGAVWSPYYAETTREQVKEAQSLGLKVVVWTVNDPADMRRMIEWGVDGIISDRPDLLRKTAGEQGLPLPRSTPVVP